MKTRFLVVEKTDEPAARMAFKAGLVANGIDVVLWDDASNYYMAVLKDGSRVDVLWIGQIAGKNGLHVNVLSEVELNINHFEGFTEVFPQSPFIVFADE